MKKIKRIIFLDEENTSLSPITSALFQQKMEKAGVEGVSVCSRGNVVLFPEPVNQKIARISGAMGIDLSGYSAISLRAGDISRDTLILAMDASSKAVVYEKYAGATNVYTLKEYLGSSGDLKLPLGGSVDEYATIIEIISGLLDLLLEKLFPQEMEQS